jgi:hypothetical protein
MDGKVQSYDILEVTSTEQWHVYNTQTDHQKSQFHPALYKISYETQNSILQAKHKIFKC